MDRFVGSVTEGTAHTDTIVVAQISADLPDDHWNCVSGELHVHRWVKIINGFDQSDTANLEQVIHVFVVAGETFDDA